MAVYREVDVIAFLVANGCSFEGDTYQSGLGWVTSTGQVFLLPTPDKSEFGWVLDADVVEDIFVNRWLGFPVPLPVRKYP